MAELDVIGTGLGSELNSILMCENITPGDTVSYQMCKTLYASHPLGGKLVDFPLTIAQSQQRKIEVPDGPEEVLTEAYNREWLAIGADDQIMNLGRMARIYGLASMAILNRNVSPTVPVDFNTLADAEIGFNVLDPLNTAGSLVLEQNPNSIDFQKVSGIAVQGVAYHRSRSITLMHEKPIYIQYTSSAFGFVGRSIFQRALYPMKSFIRTMTTDDMVAFKAGVLIAKIKQQSSIIDRVAANVMGQKRDMVNEAGTGNTISIATDETVESLNLQNLEGPATMARTNIIENIASSAGEPAKLLLSETFAEGFGEGTEDAKHVAQHIQRIREWLAPAYAFMDKIVQYRAWNPEFYKTVQNQFPDRYGGVPYKTAFYDWVNSFKAIWPNLLEEPDSEKVKVDEVKLKGVIAMLEVLLPNLDPENKALLIQWACDNFNGLKNMFGTDLVLDYEALKAFTPVAEGGGAEDNPRFSLADSNGPRGRELSRAKLALASLSDSVARLPPPSVRKSK